VDSNEEEIVVAEAPEDALAQPEGDELALATLSTSDSDEIVEDGSAETVIGDETLAGDETLVPGGEYSSEDATSLHAGADEALVADETTSTNIMDEPLVAGGADEEMSFSDVAPTSAEFMVDEHAIAVGDEPLAEDPDLEGIALGDEDEPPPTRPAMPSAQLLKSATSRTGRRPVVEPSLGDEEEMPTRVAMRAVADSFDSEAEVTSAGRPAYVAEDATMTGAVLGVESTTDESLALDYTDPSTQPATEAVPDEEEPASEECDEASFFLDQGLTEEAREILENVAIAFPGHQRAAELMARLEALEAGGGAAPTTEETDTSTVQVPAVEPMEDAPAERDAFDLAAELAGEIDGLGGAPAAASSEDDFQYSVEEVFAEFKKGLEKVVKPEDVDTHYDLGIAYKEMGLSDDALGEFAVARKGSMGTKRELDCITMMGMLHGMRGEHTEAVKVFKEGLASEHAKDEAGMALGFSLNRSAK
jgi:hypothetical protein